MNHLTIEILNKSTTIEESIKSIKGKQVTDNQGASKCNQEEIYYGWNNENEGITSSVTWDLRKSSAYSTKPMIKWTKVKPSNYVKWTSNHKKNKSQNNSRIISSRSNTSMGQYNFNTNRTYLTKQKANESSIKKSDSEKNFNLKYLSKPIKQTKIENFIKSNPKSKKPQVTSHIRNMSAMSFQ